MDKECQTTDYAALLLADMEAKKVALENAIAAIRAVLAIGALGAVAGDSLLLKDSLAFSLSSVAAAGPAGSVGLPRGAFLSKSVTEAIKLYLSAIRKKQTNKEIAQALKDGGLESAGNFDKYVTGGLFRLKQDGIVLRFDDGWGLAEWYPESFRVRVNEKSANTDNRKPKKKAVRKSKGAKSIPEGLEQRIEAMFRSDPAKVFTAQELADALGADARAVSPSLGRMAGKQKAEKTQGGYRAFGGNIQEIPKAAKAP